MKHSQSGKEFSQDLNKQHMLTGRHKRKILTFVDNQLLQLSLGSSSLHNLLVNRICSHKTINNHWLCLANSVTSVLGLQV